MIQVYTGDGKGKTTASLGLALRAAGHGLQVEIIKFMNVALDYGLLDLESILALLHEKPPAVELILTGRNAHPDITRGAELVTGMHKVKHPYEQGISGRQGIEF